MKRDVHFYWDNQVQQSFEALENNLKVDPLQSPSIFSIYFILYLAAFDLMTGMVLVQEDESWQEQGYPLPKSSPHRYCSFITSCQKVSLDDIPCHPVTSTLLGIEKYIGCGQFKSLSIHHNLATP